MKSCLKNLDYKSYLCKTTLLTNVGSVYTTNKENYSYVKHVCPWVLLLPKQCTKHPHVISQTKLQCTGHLSFSASYYLLHYNSMFWNATRTKLFWLSWSTSFAIPFFAGRHFFKDRCFFAHKAKYAYGNNCVSLSRSSMSETNAFSYNVERQY
jgi:hypothetical protein